ncbi:MAG: asparaginase domain-containing protein [Actinomycetota bacterium]|nr:asparaginase domain-containing protein [Actinomycetota bacterium]
MVVTTGGTIGSTVDPRDGKHIGLAGQHRLEPVVTSAGATMVPLWRCSSIEVGLEEGLELARQLEAIRADWSADGIVVTVGTDTLEEIAFILEMVWAGLVPCVITGAMATPGTVGYDGDANLLDAVALARRPDVAALGVVVVLAGMVHSARYVYKADPTRRDAFRSYGPGPLGAISDRRLLGPYAGRPRRIVPLPAPGPLPFVPLVTVVSGDDGRTIRAIGDLGPNGVVVCGTGAGNVSEAALGELERFRGRDVPVVIASRSGRPAVAPEVEGSPSRNALRRMGCVFSTELSGLKARLALMLLLAGGTAGAAADWLETGPAREG